MFIADTHDQPIHLHAFWNNIAKTKPIVKVVFLEAFYHDQNPGAMNPNQIATHLADRNFNWTGTLAMDLYRLIHELAANGMEVRGIDSKMPADFLPTAMAFSRKLQWRTGEVNRHWAQKVREYLHTKTDKRYAIFGGRVHGTNLKRGPNPLLDVVCFEWTGAQYREY